MLDIFQTGGNRMNLNIAICDDEINDISILKKYISRYNVETDNNIVVSSFLSAKELLLDYSNNHYDVVLLDIEMPDINGWYIILSFARQDGSTIPMIAMDQFSDNVYYGRLYKGNSGYQLTSWNKL